MSVDKSCVTLKIGGITQFSTSDYPNNFSAVIFIQGCPWQCVYCHNPHLQNRKQKTLHDWHDIYHWLQSRKGLIDAVVFSGGEPCLEPSLKLAIQEVKELGFKIGLHTAGMYPLKLKNILPLVDWVGIDVKAPFESYEKITRVKNSGKSIETCINAIIRQNIAYECRTTIHKALLSEDELLSLAHTLSNLGVTNYIWQLFRSNGCLMESLNQIETNNYPSQNLINKVTTMFPNFKLRRNN